VIATAALTLASWIAATYIPISRHGGEYGNVEAVFGALPSVTSAAIIGITILIALFLRIFAKESAMRGLAFAPLAISLSWLTSILGLMYT